MMIPTCKVQKKSQAAQKGELMRERGSGHLYLRGTTWWCAYYVHGKLCRTSCGTDDEQKAKKFLRLKLGGVVTGQHPDIRMLRYEAMRQSYYGDYEANARKSLRHDRKGKPRLDKIVRLDGYFANFRASEITTDQIREFQKRERKRGMSNGSINRSVSALRRMFSLAKDDGRIKVAPHFPMLKEAAPRQGFVEQPQFDALKRELPGYLHHILGIGYFCGLRLSEITKLKWSQVDFLANEIQLNPGETKNDEARTIPIVPQLKSLLLAARNKTPFVCVKDGEHLKSFRKAWKSACKRAGLEGILFHDLRRSAVRNLIRAGVPQAIAMAITGHKTIEVFKRYNIVDPEDLKRAGAKLSEFSKNAENMHNSFTVEQESVTESEQQKSASRTKTN
jgi:integrase